ncbi:MAG: ABC transporter substrate-binding protein [Hydrogenophaga sp.]|uniref:ABC transporter substrate-binding protein n=1 Tax=Hydrogenophaga sp. TaxID=1904254 RepID=UPI001BBB8C61|nr:ABC transporter substrate-binding protein [Hydrogenophaga sp.]MBS3912506.1 ABC transporter substrate-binding protein [Hydrogenophaga sp.]MDP2164540.1 ABC transporter substrate-binding protein [Hydrogenophaga sp.]MDP3477358.1 ABC transporter substrate-binding protein [Hydrogenophaga sp.]
MWNRRGWCRFCASALIGSGLSVARAQVTPAPTVRTVAARLVVAVDNKTAFCYLPLTIAERLGYFKSEGLDVQIREFADPGQSVQAVIAGNAHMYSGSYSSTISLQARGQSFQSFVLQGRAPQIVLGVSQNTMRHYRQLRDLRGKKIGIMGHGSGSHRVARLLLTRVKLSDQEVQYISLPTAEMAIEAFHLRQIDAICYTDPVITALEQGGALRVVADTRTVRGNAEVFGGPMPAGSLIASTEFIGSYPRLSQSMADAMVHALKWLQTAGPSDIIKAVPESYFQDDRALYLAAFSRAREAWAPDGVMPDKGPDTAARVLAQFDNTDTLKRLQLERTFTNEFALKAKAKYRA